MKFDARASALARDKAIEEVDAAASEKWKREALRAVREVAEKREEFTTDAVWWILDQRGITPPHEPRAMGAIMRHAISLGICSTLPRTSKSVRVACHRRPLQVYQSRVVE